MIDEFRGEVEERFNKVEERFNKVEGKIDKMIEQLADIAGQFKKFDEEQVILSVRISSL